MSVHFDYVRSTTANAFAFYVDDFAFIAITEPAIRRILKIAFRLASSEPLVDLLQLNPVGAGTKDIASAFFLLLMQVLWSHELGHIYHGHCAENASYLPRAEGTDSIQPPAPINENGYMREQAMEVEADAYAARMMLSNLFDNAMGATIYRRFGSTLSEEQFNLNCLLLVLGGLFYLWGPKEFDPMTLRQYDHPPALVRMNILMNSVNDWCEEKKPAVADWGTQDRFQKIMEIVETADQERLAGESWHKQSEFLLSAEGKGYFDDLYRIEKTLRIEMAQHEWTLRSRK